MKRTRITWTVLIILALLVAPALAAPSSMNRVTWRGSGVTGDSPSLSDEIAGTQVRFAGSAVQDGSGFWSGRGTVADRNGRLRADLIVSDVTFLSEDRVYITGENAAVTANGAKIRCQAFGLTLDRSSSECTLFIEENLGHSWVWWVPGSAFRGSIQLP